MQKSNKYFIIDLVFQYNDKLSKKSCFQGGEKKYFWSK